MKGGYKNLSGTNLKISQDNYKSTGSVEPKKKGMESHYSKMLKAKQKQGAMAAGYHHQRTQSKDEGKLVLNSRIFILFNWLKCELKITENS